MADCQKLDIGQDYDSDLRFCQVYGDTACDTWYSQAVSTSDSHCCTVSDSCNRYSYESGPIGERVIDAGGPSTTLTLRLRELSNCDHTELCAPLHSMCTACAAACVQACEDETNAGNNLHVAKMSGGGVFVVCCIAVGVMAGMKKGPFAPKQPLDEGENIYSGAASSPP